MGNIEGANKIVKQFKFLQVKENKIILNDKYLSKYGAQLTGHKESIDKVLSIANCNVKSYLTKNTSDVDLKNVLKVYNGAIKTYLSQPTSYSWKSNEVRQTVRNHIELQNLNDKNKSLRENLLSDTIKIRDFIISLNIKNPFKINRDKQKDFYVKNYHKCIEREIKNNKGG